jgi:Protein of unknown function (DUF1552)
MSRLLSRRAALKGMGVSVALPFLEAMLPAVSAGATATAPLRLAFLYVPNGIHMADWRPKEEGALAVLPPTLEPLTPVKDDLLVLTGLTLDKARPHGDGGGDHARAMSAFLTGRQPRKTHGKDISAGISADQVAATAVGRTTRFASLEIGCEGGQNSGSCDTGYSCAYSSNLSWRGESTPMSKEIDPSLVFERLFGAPGEDLSDTRRQRYNQSVLDFVMDDADRLQSKLGAADRRKLDEYLSGVREIEVRIRKARPVVEIGQSKITRPVGIPRDYGEHLRLMADLLVLAFQGDLTRVSTFVFANEGSNRSYKLIGVPDGHHDLSHHGNNKEKQAKLHQINQFHVGVLAYMVQKLSTIQDGDRKLLDRCMIVYGSGNSDGNAHNHDDLPILLLGKGGGSIKPGRHVSYPKETPLMNLYLSLLDRMGAPVPTQGDSTGRLSALEG